MTEPVVIAQQSDRSAEEYNDPDTKRYVVGVVREVLCQAGSILGEVALAADRLDVVVDGIACGNSLLDDLKKLGDGAADMTAAGAAARDHAATIVAQIVAFFHMTKRDFAPVTPAPLRSL